MKVKWFSFPCKNDKNKIMIFNSVKVPQPMRNLVILPPLFPTLAMAGERIYYDCFKPKAEREAGGDGLNL